MRYGLKTEKAYRIELSTESNQINFVYGLIYIMEQKVVQYIHGSISNKWLTTHSNRTIKYSNRAVIYNRLEIMQVYLQTDPPLKRLVF